MPNDIMTPSSGAGAGSGGGSSPSASPSPSPSASPTPSPSTPSTPGVSYGVFPAPSQQVQPVATPANPFEQAATPEVTPPITPVETNSYDDFINKYGGQDRLQMAGDFFEKFAAEQFEPEAVLDHLHEISPDRYGALAKTVIGDYLPKIQEHVIGQIAQDPQMQMAALQSLGWNAEDYQNYKDFLESGQSMKPVDPEMKRIQDENRQIKESIAQRQAQEQHQERTAKYQEFRSNFAAPINEFTEKMNLPQTKEGNLMRSIINGAVDYLIGTDEKVVSNINNAYGYFMKGEAGLGANNYGNSIRAAVTEHAKQVTAHLGNLMYKASMYDQLQGNPATKGKEPLAVAQASVGSPNAQPQQPRNPISNVGGYGRFDADAIKARVDQKFGL